MREAKSTFVCDGCGAERDAEVYITAPMGWRVLTWGSGWSGEEKREAHYCHTCAPRVLEALDILLRFHA